MRLLSLLLLALAFPLSGTAASLFASGPWCGNVTATSATAAVHVVPAGASVRWVLSENRALTAAIYSTPKSVPAASGGVVKLDARGLKPGTEYFYGFEIDGVLQTDALSRGRFRTFPVGAASFKIAFASCGDYRQADQSAYDAILAEQPLLFIDTGDLHYGEVNSTRPADYRVHYDGALSQPNQAALYRDVPLAYVWDDHDYCGNDSDGRSAGRDTVRRVYDEFVPHYPFGPSDGTIGQAFTIGRVRVIMTDLRSASSDRAAPDSAAKTHLGAAQKAWFKQELIAARDANFPLILWVASVPWIGADGTGNDDWSVYATERREIANFIKVNRIANVALLCGDMHALAYDDGRDSDYADGGGAPLIVLHASALTRPGSIKGGPYSGGVFPGSQQYGILEITDDGGSLVKARFTGKHSREGAKLSYNFAALTAAATTGAAGAFVNISARSYLMSRDAAAIAGFVIGGTAPRTVLIRAVGPSLKPLGVSDALADPKFTVHHGQTIVASNDNWADSDAVSQLPAAFARVGAFGFVDIASKDAATLLTLSPGVYSVVAQSADGGAGTVLVELYEVP